MTTAYKMKALKIACFAMGLAGIANIAFNYSTAPAVVPQQQPTMGPSVAFSLLIGVISAILCVKLAGKLHRSKVGWGIFGFFLSYIACFILPFLNERDPSAPRNSWWNTAGSSGSSWGNSYGGTSYYGQKTCSRCGRVVPSTSRPGQSCPHCGAYWSTESEKRK
jgi:hypothetical protein